MHKYFGILTLEVICVLRLRSSYVCICLRFQNKCVREFLPATPLFERCCVDFAPVLKPFLYILVLLYALKRKCTGLSYEPVREKTNNLGFDQVRYKSGCTVTKMVGGWKFFI